MNIVNVKFACLIFWLCFQDSITLRVNDSVLLLGQDFVPTPLNVPVNLTMTLIVAN